VFAAFIYFHRDPFYRPVYAIVVAIYNNALRESSGSLDWALYLSSADPVMNYSSRTAAKPFYTTPLSTFCRDST
jgi:hypothetical protein